MCLFFFFFWSFALQRQTLVQADFDRVPSSVDQEHLMKIMIMIIIIIIFRFRLTFEFEGTLAIS